MSLSNSDRLERLETILGSLIHGLSADYRARAIRYMGLTVPTGGSCGDGNFDRQERRRQEKLLDDCEFFVTYGKFPNE
jgi:hypothetical protein